MQVLSTEKVSFETGHNAFTDLKHYDAAYWLAYRHDKAHLSETGQVRIMNSVDGHTWTPVPFPQIEGDVRDCKFYVLDGKLRLLIPMRKKFLWWWNYMTLESIYFNGHWSDPQVFINKWIAWRPKIISDKAFIPMFWHGGGMDDYENWRVGLMILPDGKKINTFYNGRAANETEIIPYGDTIYGIVRREGQDAALIKLFGNHEIFTLPTPMMSPVALQISEHEFLVAGRNAFMPINIEDFNYRLAVRLKLYRQYVELYRLDLKAMTIQRLGRIAGGAGHDCGYCGIEKTPRGTFLVSYYDGDVTETHVYVAEIKLNLEGQQMVKKKKKA